MRSKWMDERFNSVSNLISLLCLLEICSAGKLWPFSDPALFIERMK
jgi:hypothetical protein